MDFDKNDRARIMEALADTNPENPIAMAVAEKITEFSKTIADQAKRTGKWPTELILHKPETEFDDIVIELTLQEITDATGQKISIHWQSSEP